MTRCLGFYKCRGSRGLAPTRVRLTPSARSEAKSTGNSQDQPENTEQDKMAAEKKPTLRDIFEMVKNTNTTVTNMEIQLKHLEYEGNQEIQRVSTQLQSLTTNINHYTDQITELEKAVKGQKVIIDSMANKIQEMENN